MNEQKSRLDQALDLTFYAPLGLALTARDQLPQLAEKGRQTLSGQVLMARIIGKMAVQQGQQEAGKAIKQATATLVGLGILPGSPQATTPARVPPPAVGDAPETTNGPETNNGKLRRRAVGSTPASEGLAIPGYDSLSASQVVQRLAGLGPDDLEAVRVYESATRGRRTILNKIAQLQSERS